MSDSSAEKGPRGFQACSATMNRIAEYRQPVLIYNPTAGKFRRNPKRLLDRATYALHQAGVEPRIVPTDHAGHATSLARGLVQAGADLVLVLAGDGTINEVANGLAESGVPMGILPGGTANVLAMELGLGSRVATAAGLLATSVPRKVGLGRVVLADGASRYFLMMCGAGLDARIVHDLNSGFKAVAGKLAYWASGLAHVRYQVQPLDFKADGLAQRCGFALISRVRNYGGDLEIARGASLLRNDFEIVLFEGSNPLRYAWYLSGVLSGKVESMAGVHVVASDRAEVLTGAHLQIDGEYLGRGPAALEMAPEALTLLVPPAYEAHSQEACPPRAVRQ